MPPRLVVVFHITFDDLPGGIPEQHRFDIIPLPTDGVHLIILPQLGENIVLPPHNGREVDQYGHRRPLDAPPPADPHPQPLGSHHRTPIPQQSRILLELPVFALAGQVRTDHHVPVVAEPFHGGQSLGPHDGVDPADLVTYLPADLEQQVGCMSRIFAHTEIELKCSLFTDTKKRARFPHGRCGKDNIFRRLYTIVRPKAPPGYRERFG